MRKPVHKFAAGTAHHEDWPVAMDRALAMLDMPFGANLGFAYFTDQYGSDVQAMVERLSMLTPSRPTCRI